jgi:hypothetical protein
MEKGCQLRGFFLFAARQGHFWVTASIKNHET